MKSILEDPLVMKYFGECFCVNSKNQHEACRTIMALRIVEAMETSINRGDTCLQQIDKDDWKLVADCQIVVEGFHPYGLRLPDAFQKPKDKPEIVEVCGIKFKLDPSLAKGEWYIVSGKPLPLVRKEREEMG